MRVVRPLQSDKARGVFGERVIYSTWKGRPYVKRYAKPGNPKSKKQRAHRKLFKEASKAYRGLPEQEKERLNRKAQKLKISGFNLFVKETMQGNKKSKVVLQEKKA